MLPLKTPGLAKYARPGAPSDHSPACERRRCTTSAMLFSWKRRIAAMPAAPAARQDSAFARVIPPRARTGILLCTLGEVLEAGGAGTFFLEDWGEDGEGCGVGGGLGYFCRRVTGDCDQGWLWRVCAGESPAPHSLSRSLLLLVERCRWSGGGRRRLRRLALRQRAS